MPPAVSNKLKWILPSEIEPYTIQNLTTEVENLHPIIAEILLRRGINSYQAVKDYFENDLKRIHDFGELKDCDKAANRVKDAIDSGEKILIYGDYDVDGTTAVSMLYLFLKSQNADVSYYIPDRYSEGYGVSEAGVKHALEHKADLMITVDCGISAVSELNKLSQNGVDVIICDHHLPGNELPKVFAILNPMQADCTFEGKELSGCGVGLMLLIALSRKLNIPNEWTKYLDLAAIATCCDIVPITGINRIIVYWGMNQMNTQRRKSIEALLKVARYNEAVNVSDVVFKIGPRINAAGRLDHARLAVSMFIESNAEKAVELARQIDALNAQRKSLDQDITQSAVNMMRLADPNLSRRATVVHSDGWHKGVLGIVASRLIEHCNRPTLVFTNIDGMLTGSGRSVNGINLFEALQECRHHLLKFGGHAAAAGLSLSVNALHDFTLAFEEALSKQISGSWAPAELGIDIKTSFDKWFNHEFKRFWAQLNRCRPFGPENLEPIFVTDHCFIKSAKIVGQDHLKFDVYEKHQPRITIPVIAFGMGHLYDALISGREFSLAYTIEENVWNGNRSLQLSAKAIELS